MPVALDAGSCGATVGALIWLKEPREELSDQVDHDGLRQLQEGKWKGICYKSAEADGF